MKINYHIHTTFSDGSSSMPDYCKAAIQKGFDEIAFTDHLTVFPDGSVEPHSLSLLKLESYVREVKTVSEKYKDRLTVRLGLEVDYIPGNENILEDVLKNYDFDLLIGGVHFVGNICIDSSRQRRVMEQEVKRNGFNKFYSAYLSIVAKAIETGFFDILGHMDLVRIWGFTPSNGDFEEQRVLNLVKRKNMCLEVSSRGMRQPVKSIYPSHRIMSEARELEIPIVIGTDAHTSEEIDYAYDFLTSYVRTFGYTRVATFNRHRILEKAL